MTNFLRTLKLFKAYLVFSFLAVVFLASSWSLLRPGFFRAHDYVHASRIAEMTRALEAGHFPVRWSQNFGYGFGMPLFEFYAPLPFYIGSIFHILGADLVFATKLLFLIANLGSLLGSFFLGKKLFGYRGGVLLATAFTLAPYRAVNLFIRGALSEAWGMMALPWILLGIVELSTQRSKKSFITLVLGLVTLQLSHNLTTLMFLPLSVIYAVTFVLLNERKIQTSIAKLITIGCGYILSIGISSFYLIPAFVEKNLTQIDTILGGYFHYSNHFLYIRQFLVPNWGYGGSGWGPNDEISFFLGFGQIFSLLVVILISLFLLKKTLIKRQKSYLPTLAHLSLLGGLLGLSLFMTLLKSQPIWDKVELLSFIQFPWRFLATAILFLAILVAFGLKLIKLRLMRMAYFVIVFLGITLGNFYYFRPEKMMDNPSDLYYGDEEKIRNAQSGVLKDYIPKNMDYNGDTLRANYLDFQFPPKTTIELNDPHQKIYHFELSEGAMVELPIANFPNWTVEINGEKTEVLTSKNGLLMTNLPAGSHTVGVKFDNSPIRNVADFISTASFIIFVYVTTQSKLFTGSSAKKLVKLNSE